MPSWTSAKQFARWAAKGENLPNDKRKQARIKEKRYVLLITLNWEKCAFLYVRVLRRVCLCEFGLFDLELYQYVWWFDIKQFRISSHRSARVLPIDNYCLRQRRPNKTNITLCLKSRNVIITRRHRRNPPSITLTANLAWLVDFFFYGKR